MSFVEPPQQQHSSTTNDCNFVQLESLIAYQKTTQIIVQWNKEKKLDVLGLSVRGESYGPSWKTKQYIICRKLIKSTLRFWGTKRLFHPNFDQNSIISYISNRRRFCDLFEPKECYKYFPLCFLWALIFPISL